MAGSATKGQTFQIGDLVWARMKGFPPWPGRVSEAPKEMKKTPKKNASTYCIYFFGSNNYGWIEGVNIKPYLEFKEDLTKTCKTAQFKDACASIEEFRLKGTNSLPTESLNPEEDAFDKLISPPATPKQSKVKSRKSEAPSTSDDKIDSEKKQKKSAEKKISVAKKSDKTPSLKRVSSPSVNGEMPKKKSKKEDKESDEAESKSHIDVHNLDRFIKTTYKSDFSVRNKYEDEGISSSLTDVAVNMDTISQTLKDKNIKPSDLKFGFIGLGIMGSGIVKNLINSGHKVIVWNRTSEKVQKFADIGAEVGGSPYEVMKATDITFSCLAGPSVAKLCVFGPNGVINAVDETKCYIELTSIDAETSMDIADAICSRGGRYLEAQLQGSKNEAEEGKLVILCAGDRYVYDRCQSCFEAFGNASYFLGDAGSAAKMNLVIQLISGVTLGALAEGMALAERVGLQQADVLEILTLTSLNCPLVIEKAKLILETYFPSSLPLKHLQKDLSLSLSLGDLVEHPLPLTAAANEIYKHARRIGYANNDASAVYVRARF